MKVKGTPLNVKFTHVDYTKEGEVFHKTIAKCHVDCMNVPEIICGTYFSMFSKDDICGDDVFLYAETVCKSGDTFDPVKGEKIARKKIMKKFMSQVRQASEKRLETLCREWNELEEMYQDASKSIDKILAYLQSE